MRVDQAELLVEKLEELFEAKAEYDRADPDYRRSEHVERARKALTVAIHTMFRNVP